MSYIRGCDREQVHLLPAYVEDWGDAPVRFIEAFAGTLDVAGLGFERAEPARTGRPGYDPRDMLRLYLYGYLNRIRSRRRLEAQAARNLELMWLLHGLRPDFKTIDGHVFGRLRQWGHDTFLAVAWRWCAPSSASARWSTTCGACSTFWGSTNCPKRRAMQHEKAHFRLDRTAVERAARKFASAHWRKTCRARGHERIEQSVLIGDAAPTNVFTHPVPRRAT